MPRSLRAGLFALTLAALPAGAALAQEAAAAPAAPTETANAAEAAAPAPAPGMVAEPCPVSTQGLWALSPEVLKNDWGWRCRFQKENVAMGDKAPRVVFMGDSITEGWSRLDPDLFAQGFANRGISGQTSSQMLVRFYQDVVALRPQVVHIMAGTNDIAGNGGPTSAEEYRNTIRAMVDIARANHIQVVLGSIPPADHFDWIPGIKPALQIKDLNAWLKSYARDNGLTFADYHSALTGPNGEMLPAYATDGVHPITAGYAVMRPIAARAIADAEAKAAKEAKAVKRTSRKRG